MYPMVLNSYFFAQTDDTMFKLPVFMLFGFFLVTEEICYGVIFAKELTDITGFKEFTCNYVSITVSH